VGGVGSWRTVGKMGRRRSFGPLGGRESGACFMAASGMFVACGGPMGGGCGVGGHFVSLSDH